MLPITDIQKEEIHCSPDVWYDDLFIGFEYQILVCFEAGDCQGDLLTIFKDGDRIGYLCSGYGSCSGCDALQCCSTMSKLDELYQRLHSEIKWFDSAAEALQFIRTHDWAGDYLGEENTAEFVRLATAALEAL